MLILTTHQTWIEHFEKEGGFSHTICLYYKIDISCGYVMSTGEEKRSLGFLNIFDPSWIQLSTMRASTVVIFRQASKGIKKVELTRSNAIPCVSSRENIKFVNMLSISGDSFSIKKFRTAVILTQVTRNVTKIAPDPTNEYPCVSHREIKHSLSVVLEHPPKPSHGQTEIFVLGG